MQRVIYYNGEMKSDFDYIEYKTELKMKHLFKIFLKIFLITNKYKHTPNVNYNFFKNPKDKNLQNYICYFLLIIVFVKNYFSIKLFYV